MNCNVSVFMITKAFLLFNAASITQPFVGRGGRFQPLESARALALALALAISHFCPSQNTYEHWQTGRVQTPHGKEWLEYSRQSKTVSVCKWYLFFFCLFVCGVNSFFCFTLQYWLFQCFLFKVGVFFPPQVQQKHQKAKGEIFQERQPCCYAALLCNAGWPRANGTDVDAHTFSSVGWRSPNAAV